MKQVIKSLLFAFCVIGAPNNVYAYPFKLNPASFQNYMNTVKWSPGNKVKFQDLNNCVESKPSIPESYYTKGTPYPWDGSYQCYDGFITWTNPQGTRVCEVESVYFANRIHPHPQPDKRGPQFSVKGCRWK